MFHAIMIIFLVVLSWIYGKWKQWKQFLPTIMYFSIFNLYYQYISFNFKKLWEIKKPFISLFITDTLYIFVAFPFLVVWYLSGMPNSFKSKLLYYLKWIIFSTLLEILAVHLNYFEYMNGWNVWWSVLFYFIMYPMIYYFYIKPIKAFILSLIIVVFYLYMFDYFPLIVN